MNYPIPVNTSLIAFGSIPIGTFVVTSMRVPSDALGGCCRVVSASVCSGSAISAGSIPTFELIYTNSGGTILGTIASRAEVALTAGTPAALTVTETVVDAGQYIGWKVGGTAACAGQVYLTGSFNIVPGY